MRVISIKQLHAQTGRWVRAARKEPIVVTDRGEAIAALQPHRPDASPKAIFALKTRGLRPRLPADSTAFISADRDGR